MTFSRKKLQKELNKYKRLSLRDPLTRLYNRRKLDEDMKELIALWKRKESYSIIVLLDINKFKKINDTKGHKTGDKTLIKIAKCLKKSIRPYDRAYRLSGDEFVVIYKYPKAWKETYVENRIRDNLEKINIQVSMGSCLIKPKCLEIADKKMYKEKRRKK